MTLIGLMFSLLYSAQGETKPALQHGITNQGWRKNCKSWWAYYKVGSSYLQLGASMYTMALRLLVVPIDECATLSKVLYLVLTCSNLKVFSSSRMCTKLKQILELNSLYYYSVLTCSSTFS